ncbi:MAG TPA: helix-turn-helix domain-containing protein [Thermoplasmata archaeon]|nr:helix-turn-helix domain-containing protein [Thermoplasmata archaeon]
MQTETEVLPPPTTEFITCPIFASLGTLGRKWTLTILRDIAFFPGATFGLIRKNNPGLRQRTLSLRLRQLAAEGLIERETTLGARRPRYVLAPKGKDVWPVLTALMEYGVKNHPSAVFQDGRSRAVGQLYPGSADVMLRDLARFARQKS